MTRETISLRQCPQGDAAVLCIEGDDPEKFPQWLSESAHPYDRWFYERAQEIWQLTGLAREGKAITLFDWGRS